MYKEEEGIFWVRCQWPPNRELPPVRSRGPIEPRASGEPRNRVHINEETLVPAWQRYDGSFYQSARDALARAVEDQLHLLILSGGYGALLAIEPIGCYDAPLRRCWWPERVLEDVLAGYAQHYHLKRLRAFIPAKDGYCPYRQIVERVDWRAVGVDDSVICTPGNGRQAGEEFAALLCPAHE